MVVNYVVNKSCDVNKMGLALQNTPDYVGATLPLSWLDLLGLTYHCLIYTNLKYPGTLIRNIS